MNEGDWRPGSFAAQENSEWLSLLEKELKASSLLPKELAGLIEKAMRDRRPVEGRNEDAAAANMRKEPLPERLIAELHAAQERSRAELLTSQPVVDEAHTAEPASPAPAGARGSFLQKLAAGSRALSGRLRELKRRLSHYDWRGRYLLALSLLHRHVFDRRIERLLFIKTAGLHSSMELARDGRKEFRYQGPIPAMALGWAFSALPSDLKRYAFVDLCADNGRTLLLACARNFEHAAGYAFDSESCAILEMNLAQYSRSYMACRDVRAVRGDREGISIPPQPTVLFAPESLSEGQLHTVLSHLAAAIRLNPRPLYLIVENSGRECGLEDMLLFRKQPLPLFSRLKLKLFSPSSVAVYTPLNCGEPG